MKPYFHARNSVKKWGGKLEDYTPLHDFMDSSKSSVADMRHRAMFHHAFGIFILEQVFGKYLDENGNIKQRSYITNSDGIKVQIRDVGEQHVLEDLGTIPTLADYLKNMDLQKWMGGLEDKRKRRRVISLVD